MASSLHYYLLQFTIFFPLFHQNLCSTSKQTLLLPIKKTSGHPHTRASLLSSTATSKLSFHHNVSLTVTVSVGSPPQEVTMVLDTGSELSWLHCNKEPNLTSIFNLQASSSYIPIPCSSPVCKIKTQNLTNPVSCDQKKLCHAVLSYADATSIEGNLAYDTFVIGSSARPSTIFGCMDSGFSSNSEEDAKTTGLMGMNRGSLSFVNQMGFPKFSYCISGFDSSGVLLLGDENISWLTGLNYTPLVIRSDPLPYFDRVAYTVQLEGIKVGSKMLELQKSAFEPDHTGAGQTIIDSGTQFTYLLSSVYTALRNEFMQQTRGLLRKLEDPDYVFQGAMDLCFLLESNRTVLPELPQVSLMFSGAELHVSGEKLLYRVPGMVSGKDSVHCFTFGNSDLMGIEEFVIGHHHQQSVWMEFDLVNSRVGFAEVRCAQAAQRLGIAA